MSSGKRLVTRSIPDWRSYWNSARYSVLVSQAGCNGRGTSPPFFFFFFFFFLPSQWDVSALHQMPFAVIQHATRETDTTSREERWLMYMWAGVSARNSNRKGSQALTHVEFGKHCMAPPAFGYIEHICQHTLKIEDISALWTRKGT